MLIANVDVVFVVQSLSGGGVNVNRLERELVVAWESGARPVVVLTKADMCEDVDAQHARAEEIAFGADVIVESVVSGMGIEEVRGQVPEGVTAAFLGGSGVGKSTLINRLVGEELQATNEVRSGDDKGRHTTVAREIVLMPGGGVVIDTPGMRALALWDSSEGIASAFPRDRSARRALPLPRLRARERARLCGDSRRGSGRSTRQASGQLPEAHGRTRGARPQARRACVAREGAVQQGHREGGQGVLQDRAQAQG